MLLTTITVAATIIITTTTEIHIYVVWSPLSEAVLNSLLSVSFTENMMLERVTFKLDHALIFQNAPLA